MTTTQAHPNPIHKSVAAGEIVKQLEHEIRMEIEYLLSTEGLESHPDMKEAQKTNTTGSVPIENLLEYERLKKIGVTRETLLNACSESDIVEINGDGTGIKRKEGKSLEEFEPDLQKKRKLTEEGASTADEKEHDMKLYKVTLADADPELDDDKLKSELKKAFDTEISYVRMSGKEAYFSIDEAHISQEVKAKLAHAEVEIFGVTTKIQECWDEDLDEFYKKHGKHLDAFLERSGRRRRLRATKDEVDLVFYNKKYTNIKPLEYLFESILSKSKNDEIINPSDHQLLRELITYHEKFDELVKNLKHFTVGHNPKDPVSRCFFAVNNHGTKMPFTFEECYTNLLDCFKQAREDIEVKK